jgi:hypothetical protein
MTAYDETVKIVSERIRKMTTSLKTEGDIRKAFSLLPGLAYPLRGLMDISNDPDEMFMSYLLIDCLGNTQSVYDGHIDRWYEINSENVKELRSALQNLCEGIIQPLKEKNKIAVIEIVQEFWVKFHKLSREVSSDIPSG